MTRAQIISEYERVNRKYEALFFPRVKRVLHSFTMATVRRLQADGYEAARRFLHEQTSSQEMAAVITDLYTTVGKRHAQMTYSRLLANIRKSYATEIETKGFGFNSAWVRYILQYLNRFLTDKITFAIITTSRDALLRALDEGINKGWGVDKMVDSLTDWPYERFQAARIVRTEVNRAANVGSKAQAETSKYEQVKEWISAQDFRVRGSKPKDHASHVGLNGVTIDEGDQFVDPRNGDRLDFPGDPRGRAESTINCRCQAAYHFKRDINGEPIPKRQSTTVIYPGQIRRPQTVTI